MTAFVGPANDPRRYRLDGVDPVAAGGQGFLYRAVHDDGTTVALKQLTTVPLEEWPALERQLRLVAGLDHPHLARHLDAFVGPPPFAGDVPASEEFDIPYTVMSWIEGRPLAEAAPGAALTEVLGWLRDVAHAAAALHRRPTATGAGVLHRDIKPANVLVTPAGAVLVDYGVVAPSGAGARRGAGSPGWMPPEIFSPGPPPGPPADVWQVAGLASWSVLGRPPGARARDGHARALERALRRRGVRGARRLASHIDAGLAPRPDDRPSDLRRWGDRLVTLAAPRNRAGRRIAIAGAAIGLAGALIAVQRAAVPETAPIPRGADPVGTVTVSHPPGPLDTGEPVVITVELDPVAFEGSLLRIRAHRAGREVATAGDPVERSIAGSRHVEHVSFRPEPEGAVVVDEVTVELRRVGEARPYAVQRVPLDLVVAAPLPPGLACTPYDPTLVRADGPHVLAGGARLVDAGTPGTAAELAELVRLADEHCMMGEHAPERHVVDYWRRAGRLLAPPPESPALPRRTCRTYDPAELALSPLGQDEWALSSSGADVLLQLVSRADADRALLVARHYTAVCTIGRDDGDARVHTYWR